MSKVKIDKNVPPPARYWWTKYPFADMKVGDSFTAPKELQASVAAAASAFAKRRKNGWKFMTSSRYQSADKVRIWRVK